MSRTGALIVFAAGLLALPLLPPRPAAAAWPADPAVNVPLCTATGNKYYPKMVTDGAGGAIVTWMDARGSDYDIYAQHVLASGTVDPAWPVDGRALCTATNIQELPVIAPDGAGGAIVAWYDYRSGMAHLYAQRVLAGGAVDPAWPADGRALCVPADDEQNPAIVADGAGGAVVAWMDGRSGTSSDIYAQHVSANGAVDPAWPPSGRALCTAAGNQYSPMIVTDGADGAIVTWYDYRNGTENPDIFAQHVLAGGAVDPAWPADGRALCTATNYQQHPTLVADGAGGAIVTWFDYRSGTNHDIYAQHVLAGGAVDPAWPTDGRALCTAAGDQAYPVITADGGAPAAGGSGAIVSWMDARGGVNDIYAQHVLASGAVDPAWPADGRALCTAAGSQYSPAIFADGAGGAVVTWWDMRGGSGDVYAQHVRASGAVDAAWPADGRALCTAAGNQESPVIVGAGTDGAIVAWMDLRSGTHFDVYAQYVRMDGQLGGDVVSVPGDAPLAFALEPVRPNPSRGGTLTIRFALPGAEPAALELLDIAGRRIATREVGSLGAGRHTLEIGEGRRLAPGLYLVRLRQGTKTRVTRVAVLR